MTTPKPLLNGSTEHERMRVYLVEQMNLAAFDLAQLPEGPDRERILSWQARLTEQLWPDLVGGPMPSVE